MKTGRAIRPSVGSPETKKDPAHGVLKTLKVNARPTINTSPSMTLSSPSTPVAPTSTISGSETGSTKSLKVNTRPVLLSSPSMTMASPTSSENATKTARFGSRPALITSPSMTLKSQQPFSTNFASPVTSSGSKDRTPITRSASQSVSTPTSSSRPNNLSVSEAIKTESTPTHNVDAATFSSPGIAELNVAPNSPDSSSLSSSGAGSEKANNTSSIPKANTAATVVASSVISAPSSSSGTSSAVVQGEQNIKVAVRVRPLLPAERDNSEKKTWEWTNNSIQLLESEVSIYNQYAKTVSVKQAYQFDHLFTPESTNELIFDGVVRNIVQSAMEGFHGSVFTYGQTSSGKTFTMNGDKNQPGIIPQAIAECFDRVQSMPGRDFILRVSYLEVYNEQIKDLLSMDPVPVRIQHDPKRGTVLSGVKEQVVLNTQQVLALIKSGEAHRHVGSTDMNEKSSRAHTLFKIIIESTSSSGKEPVRVSSLYLVDLAGSESAKMTNSKGERAREAKHINQSLLTLSTIIQRLSEERQGPGGTRRQHLPYRDSKLTRILESALDGNAQIGIICTVSPTFKCVDETSNTLKFASRAKMIKMSAKINETIDDKTLLRVYKEEIEQLRVRLQELESQTRQNALQYASNNNHNNTYNNNNNGNNGNSDTPTILTRSNSRDSMTAAAEEEDANLMLQMIAEMERLILRADVSKSLALPRVSRKASRAKVAEGQGDGVAGADHPRTDKRVSQQQREDVQLKSGRAGKPSASAVGLSKPSTSSGLKSEGVRKMRSNAAMLSMFIEAANSDQLVSADAEENFDSEHSYEGGSGSSDDESVASYDINAPIDAPAKKKGKHVRLMSAGGNSASNPSSESSLAPSNLPSVAHPVLERRSSTSALQDSHHITLVRKDTFLANGKPSSSAYSTATGGGGSGGTGTGIPRVLRPQTVRAASMRAMSASVDDDDYSLRSTDQQQPIHRFDSFEDSGCEDANRISSILTSDNDNLVDLTRDATPGLPGAFMDSIEDDSVLLGVSKMLLILKGHVSKTRGRHSSLGSSSNDLHRLEETNSPITTPGAHHERRESRELPLQMKSPEGELKLNEKFDYERLKLDYKLKEADNRFLQEELENKNKMLAMLTEGLKEVEQSQTQWLTANQDLSYELEKALYQNKCLKSEIAKLKEQQQRVQQRGDLPPEIARVLLNAPSCASIPEEGEGEENSEEEEEEVWAEAVFGLDNGPQQQQQEHSEPAGMVPGRGMLRTKQVFVESPDSDTSDSDEEA